MISIINEMNDVIHAEINNRILLKAINCIYFEVKREIQDKIEVQVKLEIIPFFAK